MSGLIETRLMDWDELTEESRKRTKTGLLLERIAVQKVGSLVWFTCGVGKKQKESREAETVEAEKEAAASCWY